MMRINSLMAAIVAGSLACGTSAFGAVIAQHVGTNDPATEGWTFNDYNGGTGVQSAGTDEEAHWNISRDPGAAGRYIFSLAPADLSDPAGWTVTARAKAITTANVDDVAFGVFDATHRWGIHLFASGAWSQNAGWGLGAQLSTDDATQAYHTYQMYYDPAGNGGDGVVYYYSDGNLLGASSRDDVPALGGVYRVDFGDNNGLGASSSNWAEVRFETGNTVVPEPASIALVLSGCTMVMVRRR